MIPRGDHARCFRSSRPRWEAGTSRWTACGSISRAMDRRARVLEWKSRVVNPILQELFANRMTVEDAAIRIERESNIVLSRYHYE